MKYAAPLCAALMLAACDGGPDGNAANTLPEGVTRAEVALFQAAVTDAGCVIGPAQAAEVTAQTGFSRDKLARITQYLTLTGDSTPTDSGFRLISGTCANA